MNLRDLAYYRTGGRCQALHEPKNISELSKIIATLAASGQAYFILGGGTNSLVLDEDWPGAVITFTQMKKLEVNGVEMICEAGVENSEIARSACAHGLSGAAWMYRLPGQLGGTIRMNARCYGGEISQLAQEVEAVMPDGTIRVFRAEEGIFRAYKDTVFMSNGAIIARAKIRLMPGDPQKIEEKMRFCEDDRKKKGQFEFPTCGCVFKNDYSVGVPSGMLLDKAGAHQLAATHVAINPQHANFVYNKGAGSRDILEMTFRMRDLVYQEFGVWLEYEMEILGALSPHLKARVEEKRAARPQIAKIEALRRAFQTRS